MLNFKRNNGLKDTLEFFDILRSPDPTLLQRGGKMEKSLKEKFQDEILAHNTLNVVVVAVKLPIGAIEIITNTQMLGEKLTYYIHAYDDDFRLKTNPAIQIVEYMIV